MRNAIVVGDIPELVRSRAGFLDCTRAWPRHQRQGPYTRDRTLDTRDHGPRAAGDREQGSDKYISRLLIKIYEQLSGQMDKVPTNSEAEFEARGVHAVWPACWL